MSIDIDDLERCAEKAGVWRAAILALVAEVRDLRMQRDEHMIDSEHAYDEGFDAGTRRGYEDERALVVAVLRKAANAPHPIERGVPSLSPAGRGLLLFHADRIERGDHLPAPS